MLEVNEAAAMGNVPPNSPQSVSSSMRPPHHHQSSNHLNGGGYSMAATIPPSYQSDVGQHTTSKDGHRKYNHNHHHHGGHHHHQYHHSQPREFTLPEPSLIIPPYLYLGGSHLNKNPHLSDYLGITHIINMAMELRPHSDLHMSPRIKYLHIRADDSLSYNIRHHFEEAFEIIDDARRTNGKVLVHCVMGISRSATIVIAYLMSRYNYSLNTAYSLVKSRRPEINPNPLFMRILQQFEQELAVKGQQRQQNSVDFNRYVKPAAPSVDQQQQQRPISTYYPSHDPYGQFTSRSYYG